MRRIFPHQSLFVKLLAFYFVCLVLGALNIGAVGSLLKVVAFLPVFWWLCAKHSVRVDRVLLSACFFLGFSTLSVFWTISRPDTLVGMVGSVSLLMLLLASSAYVYSEENIQFLKKALVWSSRITALIILVSGAHYESRLTLGGFLNEDPNYLCAYYLFGIVYAVECILSGQKHTHKLAGMAELGVYAALVLATGSRGGTLAVVVGVAVATVGCLVRNRISVKTILLPLVLLGAISLTYFLAPYLLPQTVLERFELQEIIESQGTGRYQIWRNYWHIFLNSSFPRQLIGYGESSLVFLAQQQRLERALVAHNIFIEYLIGLGIIGLGLYLNMLWQFLKTTLRHRNVFVLSVLVGMIVLTFSTSGGGKPYWNILIFIICLARLSLPAEKPHE